MKRLFDGIVSALAYFSILPLGPLARHVAPGPLAVAFLPFVGALIGAAAGAVSLLVTSHAHAWFPLVAWISCIVFSGAIHVDGFLDCCDGLLVAAPPERRLEILHDPRHGTFAVAGMAMLAITWLAAIARLPASHAVLALAFTGSLARISAIANASIFPYARPGAVTAAFVSRPNPIVLVLALLLTCALGWALDPLLFAIVPGAIALSLGLGWWASRRLGGGLTGDVFGAIVVVVEVCALIVVGAV